MGRICGQTRLCKFHAGIKVFPAEWSSSSYGYFRCLLAFLCLIFCPDLSVVARNLTLGRKSLFICEGKLWRFICFIVITNLRNLLWYLDFRASTFRSHGAHRNVRRKLAHLWMLANKIHGLRDVRAWGIVLELIKSFQL